MMMSPQTGETTTATDTATDNAIGMTTAGPIINDTWTVFRGNTRPTSPPDTTTGITTGPASIASWSPGENDRHEKENVSRVVDAFGRPCRAMFSRCGGSRSAVRLAKIGAGGAEKRYGTGTGHCSARQWGSTRRD